MDRRNFLRLVSIASAGLASANELKGMPNAFYPGYKYASYCKACLAQCGTIISVKDGKICDINGNLNHPVNHGELCSLGRKAVFNLSHTNRLTVPLVKRNGKQERININNAKKEFISRFKTRLSVPEKIGLIFPLLTATEYKFINEFMDDFKIKNYLCFEPINYEYIWKANELSFGKKAAPQYDFKDCDAVISFGCDFLDTWLSPVKFSSNFYKSKEEKHANIKLVYIGSRLTKTASNADNIYKVDSDFELYFALAVLNSLLYVCSGDLVLSKFKSLISKFTPDFVESKYGISKEAVSHVVELIKKSKRSIVLSGDDDSENSIKLMIVVNIINFLAGNYGKTIYFGNDYSHWNLSDKAEVISFIDKLKNKEIDYIINYKSDPIRQLPKDFCNSIDNVCLSSFSSIKNDTVNSSDLAIPISTIQESWGDSESLSKVYNLHEPALEPPNGIFAVGDVFLDIIKNINPLIANKYPAVYLEYLKNNWKQIHKEIGDNNDFDTFFKESVEMGSVWKELPKERPFIDEKILSLFYK